VALTPGSRLGAYEIVAAIGAGGMGEVYRAHDTRLERHVAIKVLPPAFASDPERLARFEREARSLAALNHPNIAGIHGVEESGGTRALVMELVEGDDLSKRIARGPVALDEALAIAKQIADALEAAHDQGIVHRDLKPANVKVRDDGTVKVLDFGLAKALSATGDDVSGVSVASLQDSPTLAGPATALGVILGTAAYMAPEQAKGKRVDRRVDIWAFGCVLYEMLTGEAPWRGETVTDVIAGVVTREPDWRLLPDTTPLAVQRLLRRCLEKDPRRRLRHIGDAALDIEEVLAGTPDAGTPAAPPGGATRAWQRLPVLAMLAVLVAVGAAGLTWGLTRAPAPARPITRFSVPLPTGHVLNGVGANQLAISPDGRRFAYTTLEGVYVRDFDEVEPRRLTTGVAIGVFFSPDGEWLAFSQPGGLSKVPTGGGAPRVLAEGLGVFSASFEGASWAVDGSILFATNKGVFRLPGEGGSPEMLFAREGTMVLAWPQMLPGGRHVLYNELPLGLFNRATAVVRALDGSSREVVLDNAPGVRYSETGHLLYGLNGRLHAAPFDAAARRVTGPVVTLPQAARSSALTGVFQAAFSRTGTLVFLPPGSDEEGLELTWVTRQGQASPASRVLRQHSDPRLSPDGRLVALHLQDEADDVWVHDLARGTLTRLTFENSEDETPVWSPDGRQVAYASSRGSERRIYRRAADGSTEEQLIATIASHAHVMDWSPDGRTLLLEVQGSRTESDLVLVDVATGTTQPILQSPFSEVHGRFSPDGAWLAYASNESGRHEVYVQPFPALDARVQVSTDGGGQPVWSRDGRELFYRSPTHVTATRMTSRSPAAFSSPQPLFADSFEHPQSGSHFSIDVAPDGRFLLLARPVRTDLSAPRGPEIQVVLNWADELERLAPTRK
jgi:eukaryotic-like serine/threonine-protein kinase